MDLSNIKLAVFDFDGVFTDNTVTINEEGKEYVTCFRSDGIGLKRIKDLGINIAILSTEINNVVLKRAEKLDVFCINKVDNKALALKEVAKLFKVELNQTLFVGNDINDIPAFKEAGIAVAVADCYEEARAFADFSLNKKGGKGAVREICDLLFESYSRNI